MQVLIVLIVWCQSVTKCVASQRQATNVVNLPSRTLYYKDNTFTKERSELITNIFALNRGWLNLYLSQ